MAKDPNNINDDNPFMSDDPFGKDDPFDKNESDPFNSEGDFSNMNNDDFGNSAPYSDINAADDSLPNDFSMDSAMNSEMTDNSVPEQPEIPADTGKKGKKSKKGNKPPKGKKQKVAKNTRSRPDHVDWIGADYLLLAIMFLVLVVFLAGNLAAIVGYGIGALPFMVVFSILTLILFGVPLLLWRERTFGDTPSLFDVMLSLSLSLIIISCIIVLSVQSMKYGMEIKPKVSMTEFDTQITRTFDC